MHPEVTVIVPHFEAWSYLPKTLESIKAQTVPVDVILLDDHSPNWRVYLQELPADLLEGVTFIETPRKLNWAGTLNLGFRYAQTQWVVPLNGDDLIAPSMIEECLKVRKPIVFPQQQGIITEQIYRENYLPYCAMIEKAWWDVLNGYQDTPIADWDFWARSCLRGAVPELLSGGTPGNLFTWVDRPGSETRRLGATGELNRLVAEFKEKWAIIKRPRPEVSWTQM